MRMTLKEMAYAKKFYSTPSEVSMMTNVQATLAGTEELSLTEKGVLTNQQLRPEAKMLLDVIAGANICTRMFMKNSFCVVEKYVYRMGDQLVLVENDGGELNISSPVEFESIRREMSEWIGSSNFKTSDFQGVLSFEALMVFMAIVDHYRRNTLKTYLGEPTMEAGLSESGILGYMSKPIANSLVQMMIKNYGLPKLTAEQIKSGLQQLEGLKWVTKDKGYQLGEEQKLCAQALLILDNLTLIEVIGLDGNGDLKTASGLCIGAGAKDILSLSFSGTDVEVETLTSAQQLQLIENYLLCPDA